MTDEGRQPAARDDSASADDRPMTREQWLVYHVARAPKITAQQWAETLLLLRRRNHNIRDDDDDNRQDRKKPC